MTLIIDIVDAQESVSSIFSGVLEPFRNTKYIPGVEDTVAATLNEVFSRIPESSESLRDLRGNLFWSCSWQPNEVLAKVEPAAQELRGHWRMECQEVEGTDPTDDEYLLIDSLFAARSTQDPFLVGWGPTPLHAVAAMNRMWETSHG